VTRCDCGEVSKLAGIGGGDEDVLHKSNFSQAGHWTLDTRRWHEQDTGS
jgi:hypothetical protein